MKGIGILGYGSLLSDPGVEIRPLIAGRIPTTTPFPVEYARFSCTRAGAPTVVSHPAGQPVKGEVLVLSDSVSLEEAKGLVWRRETRKERSGLRYRESSAKNAVVIRDIPGLCGLDHVLFTDFNPDGKIENPDADTLARAAVASAAEASPGQDGISYLMALIDSGVETTLTPAYVAAVLKLTGTRSLKQALRSLRKRPE